MRGYDLNASTLYKWISKSKNTANLTEEGKHTQQEKEIIELCIRNKQLEMENDILKQEAMLMGRK